MVVSISAPWPGQYLESNVAVAQFIDECDEMFEVPAKSIELPHNQCIARAQCLETSIQSGPVIFSAGGKVFIKKSGINASFDQSVTLRGKRLTAVTLDTRI